MKTFEVPLIWEAALSHLSDNLCRVMQNKHQAVYESPFSNTGNKYKCPVFEVEAYSWDELNCWDEVSDEGGQKYNFKWLDVEISWYKWMGRGMSSNVELTPEMAQVMLEECLRYLQMIDGEE